MGLIHNVKTVLKKCAEVLRMVVIVLVLTVGEECFDQPVMATDPFDDERRTQSGQPGGPVR